jgi:hypothetical protein
MLCIQYVPEVGTTGERGTPVTGELCRLLGFGYSLGIPVC